MRKLLCIAVVALVALAPITGGSATAASRGGASPRAM